MYTWVIYDISNNRNRRWVAKLCRQCGLKRVGRLNAAQKQQLEADVKTYIEEKDRLFMVSMNEGQYASMVLIGEGFDKKRVGGEYNAMFY